MSDHPSTPLPIDDIFTQPLRYEAASRKQRLINYLVDTLLYYVFLYQLFRLTGRITTGSVKGVLAPLTSHLAANMLLAYVSLPILYTVLELVTKGRSPGKYITGTIAIRTDMSSITLGNAIGRSMLRMLPFDPLTCLFGPPIHDLWSGTFVVKKSSIVY